MSGFVRAGFSFLKNMGKSKTSPTISSVKIKKNLTGRRTDRDSIIKGVDKHLKSSDPKSSPIKKKYTDKASAIHDKYEKTNLTAIATKGKARKIDKRNEESKKIFKKAKEE